MLSFKELLAVDYPATGDDQLAKNAKRRKQVGEEKVDEEILSEEDLGLFEVDEATLTPAQRARKKQLLRKNKAKIQIGQMIAKRRMANKKTVDRRAKRRARALVLKKVLKGRKKGDLAYSSRAGYEKLVSKRKSMTDRLTIKLKPKVRKDAAANLRNKK